MNRPAEQLLISAILRGGSIRTCHQHHVSKSWFPLYSDEWQYIERYYAQHKKCPSKAVFRKKFPDFQIITVDPDDIDAIIEDARHEYAEGAIAMLLDQAVDALQEEGDPFATLDMLQKRAVGISIEASTAGAVGVVRDWSEPYADVSERVERALNNGGTAGIPTGIDTLDSQTGGFQPGELWIVGARLGQGKTWVGVKCAVEALMHGENVLIESLEQPRTQMALRLYTMLGARISTKNRISAMDLHRGAGIALSDFRTFLESLGDEVPGECFVTDSTRGRSTISTIAANIERYRPTYVVVDYVTLIKAEGGGDDWRALAALSADLKMLAASYEVPIVAMAQLNREFGIGRGLPGPEALAQSDSFGQDADGVITMRRDSNDSELLHMRLSKYRHGEDSMQWTCLFQPDKGVIREMSGREMTKREENRNDDGDD